MKSTFTFGTLALTALAACFLSTGCAHRQYQSTTAYVDDKTLTAQVKSNLLRDPAIQAMNVNVSTWQRRVDLTGYVRTEQEKARAGQIAASVPGVAGVHNQLLVQTGR